MAPLVVARRPPGSCCQFLLAASLSDASVPKKGGARAKLECRLFLVQTAIGSFLGMADCRVAAPAQGWTLFFLMPTLFFYSVRPLSDHGHANNNDNSE